MTTITTTALEALEDVRRAGRRLAGMADEIDQERRDAGFALETARQKLRDFQAAGKQDAKAETRLKNAVAAAEQAADQPWAQRMEAAADAARRAPSMEREFIESHVDELAEELAERSLAAHERRDAAVRELQAALAHCQAAFDAWEPVFAAVKANRPAEESVMVGQFPATYPPGHEERRRAGAEQRSATKAHRATRDTLNDLARRVDPDLLLPPMPYEMRPGADREIGVER